MVFIFSNFQPDISIWKLYHLKLITSIPVQDFLLFDSQILNMAMWKQRKELERGVEKVRGAFA